MEQRVRKSRWKWPVRALALVLAAVLTYVFVLYESVTVVVQAVRYQGDADAIVRERRVKMGEGSAALNALISSTDFLNKSAVGRALDILSARLGSEESFAVLYNNASISIAEGKYEDALAYIDACLAGDLTGDEELLAALWLKKGCLHTLLGQKDIAMSGLERALEYNRAEVSAYYVMMQIYVERDELDQAIGCMERYCQAVDTAEARTILGDLLTAAERYREATEVYTRLVEQGEAGGHAQFMRGICRLQENELDGAESDFDACIQKDTETAMSLYYRGVIRLQNGRYEQAEEDFTRAMEQNREDAAFMELRYNRGVSRLAQERYAEAREDFDASWQAGEAVEESLFYAGVCALRLADNEQAVACFNTSLEKGRPPSQTAYYRGMAYLNLGMIQEAAADFETAAEAGDMADESFYYAGLCRMTLEEYAEAAGCFEKARTLYAGGEAFAKEDCLVLEGTCLVQAEEYLRAAAVLTEAVEEGVQPEETLYLLGVAQYGAEEYETAVKTFTEAYEKGWHSGESLLNRGLCRMAMEEYEKALDDFTKCAQEEDMARTARYYRGMCYQALGESELAQEDLLYAVEE